MSLSIMPIEAPIAKLALMCMVKAKHRNSILYHEAWYKMGAKLGIDGKTLKKYLLQCMADGLCSTETHKYNRNQTRLVYRFVAYKKALQSLLGINEYECRHFKIHKNASSFKEYQKLIERDIAANAFAKQNHNVQSHFPNKKIIMTKINDIASYSVSGGTTRRQRAAMGRLMRKLSTAEQICKASRAVRHSDCVVTGCNHIARLIMKSPTTGHKRLKEWQENNIIKLQKVASFIPVKSKEGAFAVIEQLKATKAKGNHFYSKKRGGVESILGNRVLSFDTHSLKLGEAATAALELSNA